MKTFIVFFLALTCHVVMCFFLGGGYFSVISYKDFVKSIVELL